MMMKTAIVALMGLAAVTEAASIHQYRSPIEKAIETELLEARQNKGGNNNANTGTNTCLSANAVQTGSASTGQQNGVAADGQVNSAT
jgi:transcription initiation factor TFIID subunit 15